MHQIKMTQFGSERKLMYITKAVLKDFGKFHNEELQFQPGLNVVYGVNEAGKSTLKDFMIGMLYGIDKGRGLASRTDQYTLRKPYDRPGFSGKIEVYANGRAYQVDRNFLRSEKSTQVTDMETGAAVGLTNPHSLQGTLLDIDKQTYLNTLCIGSAGAGTDKTLTDQLKKKMVNMSTTHSMEVDQARAIALLKDKKKLYNTRELDKEIKRLAEELYQDTGFDEQLSEIADEYQKLTEQLENARQKAEDIEELYQVRQTKPSEKKGTIFAVTLMLLTMLLVGIHFLPVSNEIKLIFCVGSILGVIYMLISTFAQKDRYLRSQRQKQEKRQLDYERGEALERAHIERYTERLAYLKAKEEQILQAKREKEARWAHYDSLKEQAEQMRTELKAIDVAIQTIEELSGAIYRGFGGTLNRRVSKLMERITEGKYQQVFVGEDLSIQVLEKDQYVSLPYLSTGTKEQLYFCLRMAAAELLNSPSMPLLLDDIFVTYDDERLKHTLEFLADYKANQMILFTANPRICDMFDEIGRDYNYIAL